MNFLLSGDETWPPACSLRFISGEQFGHRDRVLVDALPAGETTDVSIEMRSPENNGFHQGQWRMCTPTGMFFGGRYLWVALFIYFLHASYFVEVIWVILQVDEGGMLGVTQQFSQVDTGFSHGPQHNPMGNPFGSPNTLSSPSPSVITHPGSLPNTPDSDQRPAERGVPINPQLRLALFQVGVD
jgi:hypothetical protein